MSFEFLAQHMDKLILATPILGSIKEHQMLKRRRGDPEDGDYEDYRHEPPQRPWITKVIENALPGMLVAAVGIYITGQLNHHDIQTLGGKIQDLKAQVLTIAATQADKDAAQDGRLDRLFEIDRRGNAK